MMTLFARQKDEPELWEPPQWGDRGAQTAEGLETLRKYIEKQASREIDWYERSSRRARSGSRITRVIAISCTALGGAMPAIAGMNWLVWPLRKVLQLLGFPIDSLDGTQLNLALGQLGYVFLALAGSAVVFDKYFGFSTAWMRSVTAMIALEKMRESFRVEWTGLARQLALATNNQVPPSITDPATRMFELGKLYLIQVKEQTEKETAAWSLEFQSNLSQFEKDLRAQIEAGRPGGIDVELVDGELAVDGFELTLDQMVVEHVTGTCGSIGFVPPGLHKVSVTARVANKTYVSSQMINVVPATVVKAQLKLGIPKQITANDQSAA